MNTTINKALAAAAALAVCSFFTACGSGGGKDKSDPDISKLEGYTLWVDANYPEAIPGQISFEIQDGWPSRVKVENPLPESLDGIYAEVPVTASLEAQSLQFKNRHMTLNFTLAYTDAGGGPHAETVEIQFTFTDEVDFRDMKDSILCHPTDASITRLPEGSAGTEALRYEIPLVTGEYDAD
ncbi:MAG: hypothetical protein Q4C88_02190 [Akkermansia sp.]|nr:hypothetical protein [Akkermansia sp.]